MRPASALCPTFVANATVDRSIDTNMAPRNRYAGTSTTRLGEASLVPPPKATARHRRGPEDGWAEGSGDGPGQAAGATAAGRVTAVTGGSVERWAANHSDPHRAHRAA